MDDGQEVAGCLLVADGEWKKIWKGEFEVQQARRAAGRGRLRGGVGERTERLRSVASEAGPGPASSLAARKRPERARPRPRGLRRAAAEGAYPGARPQKPSAALPKPAFLGLGYWEQPLD
jgi:hypothetical protein